MKTIWDNLFVYAVSTFIMGTAFASIIVMVKLLAETEIDNKWVLAVFCMLYATAWCYIKVYIILFWDDYEIRRKKNDKKSNL